MVEILAAYSLSEILAILVAVALGVKGVISFYDWAVARLKQKFGKEEKNEFKKNQLEQRLALGNLKMKELEDTDKALDTKISELKTETDNKFNELMSKLNLLLASDRDAIKAHIVEKHHYFCYTKKYIDDYSLDCLEKRYEHYVAENGNSYVEDLMEELRALPKRPKQQ